MAIRSWPHTWISRELTTACITWQFHPKMASSFSSLARPVSITARKAGERIIIEKPYGNDLASARKLEKEVQRVFRESQVYRIDHYLGKETVQNILVFRFANGIFEPLWNRRYVDHVQISMSETVGVETRAAYYDTVGVTRDVFQNHLLQLLTLTAMEAPVIYQADAVRDEKVKVLMALHRMNMPGSG